MLKKAFIFFIVRGLASGSNVIGPLLLMGLNQGDLVAPYVALNTLVMFSGLLLQGPFQYTIPVESVKRTGFDKFQLSLLVYPIAWSLTFGLVIFILGQIFDLGLFSKHSVYLSVTLAAFAFSLHLSEIFRALNKMYFYSVLSGPFVQVLSTLVLLWAYINSRELSVMFLIHGFSLAIYLNLLLALGLCLMATSRVISFEGSVWMDLKGAWIIFLVTSMVFCINKSDIWYASFFLDPIEQKHYTMASRVIMIATLFNASFFTVSLTSYVLGAPKVSKESIVDQATELSFITTVFTFVFVACGAIALVFIGCLFQLGIEYLLGVFVIFSVGQFINAYSGPAGLILIANKCYSQLMTRTLCISIFLVLFIVILRPGDIFTLTLLFVGSQIALNVLMCQAAHNQLGVRSNFYMRDVRRIVPSLILRLNCFRDSLCKSRNSGG